MGNTAVVWKSQMGVSRQYAEYLKKPLRADLIEADKLTAEKLLRYTDVIFCSGVYNGEWGCTAVVKKLRTVLQSKRLVFIFAVWNDSPERLTDEELRSSYLKSVVISPDRCIAVEGAIDKSKLGFMQKMSLGSVRKKCMAKADKTDDDFEIIGMIDGLSGGFKEETAERILSLLKKPE